MGSPMWRTVGFGFGCALGTDDGEQRRGMGTVVIVDALGVRLGRGGRTGDRDRGVEAGTGVLGGIGVFVGSAIAIYRPDSAGDCCESGC